MIHQVMIMPFIQTSQSLGLNLTPLCMLSLVRFQYLWSHVQEGNFLCQHAHCMPTKSAVDMTEMKNSKKSASLNTLVASDKVTGTFIFDRINISTDPNRLLHCYASESFCSSHIFPVQPPDNFIDHQCSLTFSLCTIRDARTVLQTAYPDLCLVPDVSFFAFGRGYDPLPPSVAPASPHLLQHPFSFKQRLYQPPHIIHDNPPFQTGQMSFINTFIKNLQQGN